MDQRPEPTSLDLAPKYILHSGAATSDSVARLFPALSGIISAQEKKHAVLIVCIGGRHQVGFRTLLNRKTIILAISLHPKEVVE